MTHNAVSKHLVAELAVPADPVLPSRAISEPSRAVVGMSGCVCVFVFPQALLETALTRVVLPMPILVLPPIIMSVLEK